MENFRQFILNAQEPFIIKNILTWKFLKWDLEKWTQVFGEELLSFRLGKNQFTLEPQFENTTRSIHMTFQEFLQYQQKNPHEWLYFDYKYLRQWLKNSIELQEEISWKDVGFPLLNSEDSTIWVGSRGAHTPCHADTYGCNIIAQIYGHKRWIIFPPSENLLPTRIPYEESSIYSQLNFFTPSIEKFKEIHHCRTVILEPGDVLILPHKWWHYVENIDLAISLNTWIPLHIDNEERISESIVQMLMLHLTKNLDLQSRNEFLNPGLEADIVNTTLQSCANVVMSTLLLKNQQHIEVLQDSSASVFNIKKFHELSELTDLEFENLLEKQKENKFEFKDFQSCTEGKHQTANIKKIMNAILHPDVITMIKNKLLDDYLMVFNNTHNFFRVLPSLEGDFLIKSFFNSGQNL